ncbi:CheW protein [Ferrimonas balearica DSM 9799]|uniref:CheW protein n=1 Tax=Ferrimonas balearica (strain DSM 9799 / CCM 4581 / KCTC 23876 / PAT) TaxID=550540 RepID=E1SUS7_FERBD|nr:chemotaxis protein CheW [Ferrimonas balearica]ADN75268.1 CheW protein [Ferrimonas balearica DSM 9799]MBY5978932.1 chemotaxis protein CheW [Ferrimonas balearica]
MSRVAQQAVTDYFDVLLTEPDPVQNAGLQALLDRSHAAAEAPQPEPQAVVEVAPVEVAEVPEVAISAPKPQPEPVTASLATEPDWRDSLEARFQCLFFKVAGLTVAVPLQLLGGIKRVGQLSQLPGSAPWLMGVQVEQGRSLQVVDSARWLMPEKAKAASNYRYMVQLGGSNWALACDTLVNAEPLEQTQVKWRQPDTGTQRYLAGIVRERMCVVLDVPATISLLEAGKDISVKES